MLSQKLEIYNNMYSNNIKKISEILFGYLSEDYQIFNLVEKIVLL